MKLQDFRQFSEAIQVQPTRSQLVLPAFTLPVHVWGGASIILAEYPIGNEYFFSFKVPVDAFGAFFVPAIRWVEDSVVSRFLFFEHELMELFYPVYTGEVIGPEAVVEIWSVNSEEVPELEEQKILESSVLAFPPACQVCCSISSSSTLLVVREPTIINPYAFCNPFCLPLEV